MNDSVALEPDLTVPRCSLFEESSKEANAFRWIESERAGCDQGEFASASGFTVTGPASSGPVDRAHARGPFWVELKRNEFGLLCREFGDSRRLLDAIILQLKCGAENLDIIRWACREQPSDQRRVRELLA